MGGTISSLSICLHAIYRDVTFFLPFTYKITNSLVRNFEYHIRVRKQGTDENRMLRQIFVSKEDEPGGYRKLHTQEIHDL
jgi:hypothetical protein